MTLLLNTDKKISVRQKSIHLASCTTTISVYVKYIKYRFASYPVFRESGCKGMIFFLTDQILKDIFSKNNSFSHFPLTEIKERRKQSRQLTLKMSIAYPRNRKEVFLFPVSLQQTLFFCECYWYNRAMSRSEYSLCSSILHEMECL